MTQTKPKRVRFAICPHCSTKCKCGRRDQFGFLVTNCLNCHRTYDARNTKNWLENVENGN